MSERQTIGLLTAEEFAALPDNGMRQELIAGKVVEMPPPKRRHGYVCGQIQHAIMSWIDQHGSGYCFTNDPGVVIARGPDTVRAPDLAFYRAERMDDPMAPLYLEEPPDLVVEVVSEDDRQRDVLAKVAQWLEAGVQVVVVAWPSIARLTVHGPGEELAILGRGDVLTCESLLPGFALPVERIFG